jgi:hypothetical protein
MIWAFTREQLRSQRRYIVWASAVVALAVGAAVYGALLGTTLNAASTATQAALVSNTEFLTSGYAAEDPGTANGLNVDVPTASLAEIEAAVASAQADGNRVGALAVLWNLGLEQATDNGYVPWPTAGIGDVDWGAILTVGHQPGAGEVALSEAYAHKLGVGIGDSVPIYGGAADGDDQLTAMVSGLTRSPFDTAGVNIMGLPEVWIAWADLPSYVAALTSPDDTNIFGSAPSVNVSWDGQSTVLNKLFGAAAVFDNEPANISENSTKPWIALGTGVLVIGAIATAFAFGRAQAQSRTQWVATARALGATRRHVMLATLGEAGLLAAVGVVAGYVLGWLGTTVHLWLVHSEVPGAGIATMPQGSVWVILGALALGSVLALVIAGVPAFWATRVSPASALKPENDITNAEVGRRVQFWPVALAWVIFGSVAIFAADPTEALGAPVYGLVVLLLFIVLTVIVANELLRWLMPVIGRWLSGRPKRALMVAGDSIVARPRQFTVPGLLVALAAGTVLTVAANAILRVAADLSGTLGAETASEIFTYMWPTWLVPASAIVLGTVTLLATVIALATSGVTARERATREALGITAHQTRAAAAIVQGFTVVAGLMVGVVLAGILTFVLTSFWHLTGLDQDAILSPTIYALARAALTVIGVGAACATISCLVVAGISRTPSIPGLPTTHARSITQLESGA